jgi:hypothetical protein
MVRKKDWMLMRLPYFTYELDFRADKPGALQQLGRPLHFRFITSATEGREFKQEECFFFGSIVFFFLGRKDKTSLPIFFFLFLFLPMIYQALIKNYITGISFALRGVNFSHPRSGVGFCREKKIHFLS